MKIKPVARSASPHLPRKGHLCLWCKVARNYKFQDIGKEVDPSSIIELNVTEATKENDIITGTIDIMDVAWHLWTNISRAV